MNEEELIEALADKEHESWARWMRYLFSQGAMNENDDFVIPAKLERRWAKQAYTDYAHLSEAEKQSDRNEVEHILPIIRRFKDA